MSSTSPAIVAVRTGRRVIVRHSALVRVTHWINALCFFFLLMSGLQIFNADPALSWGNKTSFSKPFLALTSRENSDNSMPGWPWVTPSHIAGTPPATCAVAPASRAAVRIRPG